LTPSWKRGGLERRARIAAGFFQFLQDVAHGRQTEALIDIFAGVEALQTSGIADHARPCPALVGQDALNHRIGFRVHR
jgi:hypothetical protein